MHFGKIVLTFLGALALCAFTLVFLSVNTLVNETRVTVELSNQNLRALNSLIEESQQRLIDTSQNTNAILIQIGLAADNARRASEAQESYQTHLETILTKVETSVESLNATIVRTDYNLNTELLPQAVRSLKETEIATAAVTATVQQIGAEIAPVLQAATGLLEDPNIKASIANIEASSKNAVGITAETVEIAKNMNLTTQHIEKAVDKATKPGSLAVKAGSWLLSNILGIGKLLF